VNVVDSHGTWCGWNVMADVRMATRSRAVPLRCRCAIAEGGCQWALGTGVSGLDSLGKWSSAKSHGARVVGVLVDGMCQRCAVCAQGRQLPYR
jgi:hypothetical protein